LTIVRLLLFSSLFVQGQGIDSDILYTRNITSLETFKSLSLPSRGVIRQGYTIKFLIDKRDPEDPQVYFFNANYCETGNCSPKKATFHYEFAKEVLPNFSIGKGAFVQNLYFTDSLNDRDFIGGRIQSVKRDLAQDSSVVFGVRFIERDLINEDMVQYCMKALKDHFTAKGELSFVQNSIHQTTETITQWMSDQGLGIYTMEELLSNIPYIALNPGVAYGIFNVFPENPEDLEPYDLPLFKEVPLELAVVAGTITQSYQDVGSHVNLKSKERNTPNMVLRDLDKIEKLRQWHGKPVKLVVKFNSYSIEPSSEEIVFSEYEKKISRPWEQPYSGPLKDLLMFSEMCSYVAPASDCLDQSKNYGGKSSGLAFLGHPDAVGVGSDLNQDWGYRISPMGFGIPLSFYKNFVKHNYRGEFREALDHLILTEMSLSGKTPLPTKDKKQVVSKVRQVFLNAEIPNDLFQKLLLKFKELAQNVAQQYPGTVLNKVKLRSSANVEDIDGFNGAGLHDSFSARLDVSEENTKNCEIVQQKDKQTGLLEEKIKPKTLACALKAVYASLWSLRAVRERSYRRFDHRYATMGIAAQPAYKFRESIDIAANSVLITRVLGTETVYGQQLSSQINNGLVTNPTPGTRSELLNITFQSSAKNFGVNVLQFAKPKKDQDALESMVMNKEKVLQISELARTVETAFCKARQDTYFPGRDCQYVNNSVRKPKALDMEFKIFDNGEILIKQVRTFTGK